MADGTYHDPDFVALVDDAKTRIREITVDDVRAWQAAGRPFVLVDTREDHEWLRDRCAGAVHVGRGVLERDHRLVLPSKEAPVVLYCGGGYRSALSADNLQRMGYLDVYSMAGGIRAWRAAGYPLDTGRPGEDPYEPARP